MGVWCLVCAALAAGEFSKATIRDVIRPRAHMLLNRSPRHTKGEPEIDAPPAGILATRSAERGEGARKVWRVLPAPGELRAFCSAGAAIEPSARSAVRRVFAWWWSSTGDELMHSDGTPTGN